MLARHEALRARIEVVDGVPTQRIVAHERRPLAILDLRHLPRHIADAESERHAEAQARRPFDLESEPLFRALLVRLADDRAQLHVVGHHLILDGVTMFQIFFPELEATYRELAAGRPATSPPLPLRYRDVVAWTRSTAAAARWSGQEAYWQQQLAGAECLALPIDHPRTARPSHVGARRCFALSQDLSRALRELAAQQGSTLFVTLLAAFKALLFRYSQQRDLTIASVASMRALDGLDRVAGNFLNTILLRTEVPADGSFLDLLAAVGRTCLGALEHAELPFQQVARYAPADPSGARDAPIQAAFVFEPPVAGSAGGWVLGQHAIHTATSKFDLTFELDERPGGIIARVEYRSELFEAATIDRMIAHFERLLTSLVADPRARLTTLEILDPADRQLQLVTWQPDSLPPPQARTLHGIVEAQVDRTPDAIAVIGSDLRLTYRQLDERANQLARRLVELGAGPEVAVGVWTDRTAEHAVALLAILKAGAAYVPLGNSDPAERVGFILTDSAAAIVVTDRAHAGLVSGAAAVLDLDDERATIAALPCTRLALDVRPEHLAYVIYTSGTTGRPKGVLVEHGQILPRVTWGVAQLGLTADAVVVHLYALAFDAALIPIWFTWAAGAATLIPGDDALGDPLALGRMLRDEAVTHLLATPALLERLIETEALAATRLRFIQTGGDALSGALATAVRQHCDRLFNAYGPTEAAILATFWEAGANIPARPPIGMALPGTRLHVLSAAGQLLPIGAVGELHIGGEGVARGYLGRPELTQEKFIADPFAGPGARMYRTGDLVRWLPTGDLEFLGRVDRQVKLRGHRVEIGEIEAVLRATAGVRAAAVVLREDGGRKQLVAYVALSGDLVPVQAALRSQLPDYMVPAAFVVLPELPMTAHGKLDLAALPEPAHADDRERVLPRTDVERTLWNIWRAVLRLEDLSVTDDFFAIGGDSLASLTVVARAAASGLRLAMRDLLEHRSIAGIAAHIAASAATPRLAIVETEQVDPVRKHAAGHDAILRLRVAPTSTATPLFLVHPAGGSAFGYRELVRHLDGDRPVYGLECTDGYAGKTLTTMAADYVLAVRSVQPAGPYLLGGWSLGGMIAAEMARQLERAGETVSLVALLDARPTHNEQQRRYLGHMMDDDAALIALLARHLGLMVGATIDLDYRTLRELPATAREATLVDRIARHHALSEVLDADFVRRFIDDFVAAGRLIEGPQDLRPIAAPMLLLRASVSSMHYPGFPALEQPIEVGADATYGWDALAHGGCTVELVEGTHEDLLFGSNARGLAEQLSRALHRLDADTSPQPHVSTGLLDLLARRTWAGELRADTYAASSL